MKKSLLKTCLTGIAFILLIPFVTAEEGREAFVIDKQMDVINLVPHLYFLEDKTKTINLPEALTLIDQFQPSRQKFFNRGFSQSAFWLTTELSNTNNEDLSVIVHFDAPLVDFIDVYFESDNQQFSRYEHGDMQWFNHTDIKSNNVHYAQQISLPKQSTRRLLIKISSESLTSLPVNVSTVEKFSGWLANREKVRGIYHGIIIGLIIYNLMFFFTTRDRIYLFYSMFASSFIMMHMFMDGWFNDYLYQWPYLQQRGVFYLLLVIGILGAILANITLKMSTLSPKTYKVVNISVILMSLCLLISPILPLQTFAHISDSSVLAGSIILLIGAISCSRHGVSYAKYFSIGYGLLAIISSSAIAGVLTQTISINTANTASRISILLLLSFITLALSARFRQIEKKQKEAEANALEAQLKEETKSKFFANMSHEIRTPLNAVIGVSELMADTPLNSVQKNYNKIINSSGNILLTLVNNILDYSKIETGNMTIERGEVDIRSIAKEIRSVFSHLSVIKNLEFIINIDDNIPGVFYGDPTRIKQILINMLGNAFKFTSKGHVKLIVKSTPEKDAITFEISDTGIGIKSKDISSLFDPFKQADTSTYRQFGGTGLGLSIVKNLIERMNGEIQVDSKENTGTTFLIKLPIEYDSGISEQPSYILPPIRVLIAEDNPEVIHILKDNLNSLSIAYDVVTSRKSLLEKLENENSRHAFDLLLLDAQLDNNNTLELIKSIHNKKNVIPLPIALMSGTGIPVSIDELNGLDVTISETKPISASELRHFIANSLGLEKQEHAKQSEEPVLYQDEVLSILVAEDNPTNQLVTKGMLKKLNHQFVVVNNGAEAVEEYMKNYKNYDLIFMDCEMPILDGFKATKKIRLWEQENNLKKITIIALTAHAHESYTNKISSCGMDDCIIKPVSIKNLSQRLNDVFPCRVK